MVPDASELHLPVEVCSFFLRKKCWTVSPMNFGHSSLHVPWRYSQWRRYEPILTQSCIALHRCLHNVLISESPPSKIQRNCTTSCLLYALGITIPYLMQHCEIQNPGFPSWSDRLRAPTPMSHAQTIKWGSSPILHFSSPYFPRPLVHGILAIFPPK